MSSGAVRACTLACALCPGPAAAAVDLQHLAVELQFDWPARQARGTATLTLQARADTRTVALDAGHLAIASVALLDGAPLAFSYDGGDRDGGLQVSLDRGYAAGETLRLRIAYSTRWVNHSDPLNLWGSIGRGLRFFEPSTSDTRKRRQLWSSHTPASTRYWVPGIDALHDWRSSELTATVPAPLSVLSAGRLVAQTDNADGTRTFHWRSDAPHAPHRFGLVVGSYSDIRQQADGLPLHNLGYPDEAQAVADSVVLLPDMVRFFNTLTGLPLPAPRYTQVFVQDLPWGHAGAGFAVQSENMVDDHGTHADFLYLWDGLQAETLAAQWFGVHLSACDVRHIWLERGFAHHLAALFAEQQNGRDEALLWYVQGDRSTVLADWQGGLRDALVPASVDNPAAFAESNTPWARGAAVLHLLRRVLGDATWRQVLQRHVNHSGGKPVCTEDFRHAAQTASGRDLGWFFQQWVQRAGQPTFDVSWQHDATAGQVVLQVRQTQAQAYEGPVDIDIDGRIERVWLLAQADNSFRFAAPQRPQLVHFDHEGSWIKELNFNKPAAELLHQLRHTTDTVGRQWAMSELARRVLEPAAAATLRGEFEAAQPAQPVALHADTRQTLLTVVERDSTWLRASALLTLGLSRDPALAPLYIQHLRDRSDRVINSAAIALGQSGSPLALDALLALPPHPSWKNQSLISALAGLKELRDPRGAALARQALADVQSARWTLSTPVWDYRLAAAQTLAALGQGGASVPLLLAHFERSLVEGDVNDIFSNLTLLATLGDERAGPLFEPLRQRFAADADAMKAVDALLAQWRAAGTQKDELR